MNDANTKKMVLEVLNQMLAKSGLTQEEQARIRAQAVTDIESGVVTDMGDTIEEFRLGIARPIASMMAAAKASGTPDPMIAFQMLAALSATLHIFVGSMQEAGVPLVVADSAIMAGDALGLAVLATMTNDAVPAANAEGDPLFPQPNGGEVN